MIYDLVLVVSLIIIIILLLVKKIDDGFYSSIIKTEEKLKHLKEDDKDRYLYSKNTLLNTIEQKALWISLYRSLIIKLNSRFIFSATVIILFAILLLVLLIFIPRSSILYIFLLSSFNFVDGVFQATISNFLKEYSTTIYSLIKMLNNGLGILLSISLTVFIFTYRVRNNISISSNTVLQDNIHYLMFIFLTFIYGKLFLLLNIDDSLLIKEVEHIQVFLWVFMFILSINFGINRVLGRMLKSISFDEILKKTQRNTEKLTLIMCFHERSDNVVYNYLINCISSVYQTFIMSVKKNEGDSFRRNYKAWEEFITYFMQGRGEYLKTYVPYDSLNTINNENFQSLYTTLLESHIELIVTLYNQNKILEAGESLKVFHILTPHKRDSNLYQIYFRKLNELVNVIEMNHPLLLKKSLKLVREYSENNQKEMLGLMIYKGLLLKAVNENEVSKVSRIAYSMFDSIPDEELVEKANIHVSSTQAQRLLSYMEQVNDSQIYHYNYKQSIIYTILQIILKSIEQGNYASTGFLIKMLVTKLNEQKLIFQLKDTYQKFINSVDKRDENLDQMKLEKVGADPSFNHATLEYCTHKLTILLYGQQKFALINNLPGQPEYKGSFCYLWFVPYQDSLMHCPYIPYLFAKLEKAKNKYGMIYLENNIFMRSLIRDVSNL